VLGPSLLQPHLLHASHIDKLTPSADQVVEQPPRIIVTRSRGT
jgi:hypothetical protein